MSPVLTRICCLAIFACSALCGLAQAPTVIQQCKLQKNFSSKDGHIYHTICSEDDQHSVKAEITLKGFPELKVFDGDNRNAEISIPEKGTFIYTSSRLCLTIEAAQLQNGELIHWNSECVAVDRSKWPVQHAKSKE